MSRFKGEHNSASDEAGSSNYSAVPNGEYIAIVTKLEKVTYPSGFQMFVADLTVTGGDYDGSIIGHKFWLPKGENAKNDLGCEEVMDSFLYRTKAQALVEEKVPNGNSWLDDTTLDAITLAAMGKAIKIVTGTETYEKKDGSGKGTNSIVTKFMFSDDGGINGVAGQPPQASGPTTGTAIV